MVSHVPKITPTQARWFRLQRSGLQSPFQDTSEAAQALAGVQAQIQPAAALSLFNRVKTLDYPTFLSQLFAQRTLVKLWGQRGTLHLYPSQDWPLLHGALAGKPTYTERKFVQEGGTPSTFHAAVETIHTQLKKHGTLTRSQLRDTHLDIPERFLSSWGGIFHELVRRGVACHAKPSSGESSFAHREHWLPTLPWEPPHKDEANVILAERYLRTYGPSTVADFAYWRGATQRDAKHWFDQLKPTLHEVSLSGKEMWSLRDDLTDLRRPPPHKDTWPRKMLYRFDPLLLAHKDKSWLIPKQHYPRVWRKAGHIEGNILRHGRIIATWRYQRQAGGLHIVVEPFSPLDQETQTFVEQTSQQVAHFFRVPLLDIITSPPSTSSP